MHGTFKPRNKHGHSVLISKRSERHEDTTGRRAKRARLNEQYNQELEVELDDYFDGDEDTIE